MPVPAATGAHGKKLEKLVAMIVAATDFSSDRVKYPTYVTPTTLASIHAVVGFIDGDISKFSGGHSWDISGNLMIILLDADSDEDDRAASLMTFINKMDTLDGELRTASVNNPTDLQIESIAWTEPAYCPEKFGISNLGKFWAVFGAVTYS